VGGYRISDLHFALHSAEHDDFLAFAPSLERWRLTPDGAPVVTTASRLLPVRRDGAAAMLKITAEPEERRGAETLAWWGGTAAARVLARENGALLMERAEGPRSLADMARRGRDDAATRILCQATMRLHAHQQRPLPVSIVPLPEWFAALEPGAAAHGGILARAAITARQLFATPREFVVLHGDIHHGNVLDFGPRGWLAIDPKGLLGERVFDFVNILRNPDAALATAPGRFAWQASIIAETAGLDRMRLLQWTLAFAGLSAAWILADGDDPALDLAVAELAAAELGRA
jgi:streptomycin 6-kinase